MTEKQILQIKNTFFIFVCLFVLYVLFVLKSIITLLYYNTIKPTVLVGYLG